MFPILVYLRPTAGCQPHTRRGRTASGQRAGQTSICSSWDSSAPQRAAPASAHSCPPLHTGTAPELPGQSVPCMPSWGQSQSSGCPWGHIYRQSLLHMSSQWRAPSHHPQQTGSSPLQPHSGGCVLWAWAPARSSSTRLPLARAPAQPG